MSKLDDELIAGEALLYRTTRHYYELVRETADLALFGGFFFLFGIGLSLVANDQRFLVTAIPALWWVKEWAEEFIRWQREEYGCTPSRYIRVAVVNLLTWETRGVAVGINAIITIDHAANLIETKLGFERVTVKTANEHADLKGNRLPVGLYKALAELKFGARGPNTPLTGEASEAINLGREADQLRREGYLAEDRHRAIKDEVARRIEQALGVT